MPEYLYRLASISHSFFPLPAWRWASALVFRPVCPRLWKSTGTLGASKGIVFFRNPAGGNFFQRNPGKAAAGQIGPVLVGTGSIELYYRKKLYT